jgi:hypothetical protein
MPDGCLEIPRSSRYRLDNGFLMDALHSGRLHWLQSALIDTDLQRVITSWDASPEAIRVAMLALIGTVAPRRKGSSPPAPRRQKVLDETARRLARECRALVQGCLREEEWQDADREFFAVIAAGLAALNGDK